MIETDDAAQATATLTKLRNALGRERALVITPTDGGGFKVTPAGSPIGAEVAVRDDKVVFAAGGATVDDVLEPAETLADNDRFGSAQDALGDDLDARVLRRHPDDRLARSRAPAPRPATPTTRRHSRTSSALDYMIAGGSSSDGDRSTGRFVLGLKEPRRARTRRRPRSPRDARRRDIDPASI